MSMTNGCNQPEAPAMAAPTLVIVAFGTSVPAAREVFDYIDAKATQRYPGRDIRWAFTSETIRKKLAARGVATQSLAEVVADLSAAGCERAVFQSLHVAPGQEFREIDQVDTGNIKTAVGKALLTSDEDIAAVIAAVEADIDGEAVNVIVAHGNDRYPQFNAQIVAFADAIEAKHANVLVCSVEGRPGTGKLAIAKTQASQTGRVNFIPLMIVAGGHVMNDVMGDQADSWKSIVAAEQTTVTRPLGYNDAVLEVYFRHVDEASEKLFKIAQ